MSDFTSVMDEAYEEHLAAKKAEEERQEAERLARLEAQQKQRDAERQERNRIRSVHLRRIADHVGYAGAHTATVDEENFALTVDGAYLRHEMYWEEMYWGRRDTKSAIVVRGQGSNRDRHFRIHNDGTFNYQEIARLLINHADRTNTALKIKAAREFNKSTIEELAKELNLGEYQSVLKPSANPELPVTFYFQINHNMTVDKARELAATLRLFGIKLHYNDQV